MKSQIAAVVIFLVGATSGHSVLGAESGVYCKPTNGDAINILSEEGWECIGPMSGAGYGKVCFTGARKSAIDILNSPEVEELFEGTDGEGIENAKYNGPKNISYVYVDRVNDYRSVQVIKPCPRRFFD